MATQLFSVPACIVLAAVIFNDGLWDDQRGIRMYENCLSSMEGTEYARTMCGDMALQLFRAHYPHIEVDMPPCSPDEAARILWMGVFDRGAVDGLVVRLKGLCAE